MPRFEEQGTSTEEEDVSHEEHGAFDFDEAQRLRLAQGIVNALSSENQALRTTLERVLTLLVSVEESRRHGFLTSSVLQVDEVIGLARSLLSDTPKDWDEISSGLWPESLTDEQADIVATRVGVALGETPTIGLVKAWYGAILACLPILKNHGGVLDETTSFRFED